MFALSAMVFTTSCSDDINIEQSIDDSDYAGIYTNNAYLRDAKTNKATNIIELYGDSHSSAIKLGLTKAAKASTTAQVQIDAKYLDEYNLEHETEFELFPATSVTLANDGKVALAEGSKFGEIGLTISGSTALKADKTYAIPLTITSASDDVTLGDEAAKHCIYFVKDMRGLSNAYKGEDAVKGFLYIATNNVNPLNALAFELENGKLVWDYVTIFACNINYDAESGRPKVSPNPEVQFLLANHEQYLQPLRKRGIKVILGLLGNHDQAGMSTLSDQGAKDFAREVAQYVNTYKLDGVNFDDEYSKNVDPDNPAFTPPNRKAAAKLIYECKQKMPDKLMTVYNYHDSYGAIRDVHKETVNGIPASEWIDIIVPDYPDAAPVEAGGLTNKDFAGLAMEFNDGRGRRNLTPENAQWLISEGYGYYMGFSLNPGNFARAKNRMTGLETLYGSPLKPFSIFYRNQDTKVYDYNKDEIPTVS